MGLEELVGLVRRGGLDRRDGKRWEEAKEVKGDGGRKTRRKEGNGMKGDERDEEGERDGRGRTDELD